MIQIKDLTPSFTEKEEFLILLSEEEIKYVSGSGSGRIARIALEAAKYIGGNLLWDNKEKIGSAVSKGIKQNVDQFNKGWDDLYRGFILLP